LHLQLFTKKATEYLRKENFMTYKGAIIDDQGKMNNFALEPKVYVDAQGDRTGFTPYAELLNGRLAMIGFISLIALEVFTGHGIFGFLQSL
jgi:Chlorophyll A-B binding protein